MNGSTAIAALATIAFCTCLHAAPAESPLRFEEVFSDVGEPPALHYRATFQTRGTRHTIDVWRDGARRLKRVTDDRIETHVSREPGSVDYEMTVLDRARKIETRVDRANLYRVGNFTDWFDLSHGLRHPQGAYRLVAAAAPASMVERPPTTCTWYDLTQADHVVHVCWDVAHRLPARLVGERGETLWRIETVDDTPLPPGTFDLDDAAYVRNDVDADMDKD